MPGIAHADRIRAALVAAALLLTGGLLGAQAQEVEIEVGDLLDEEKGIKLQVFPELEVDPRRVDVGRLQRAKRGSMETGYQIYYEYDEDQLNPHPEGDCYLTVWVVPRGQGGAEINAWFRKFELTVEGDFMDGAFALPITVTSGGRSWEGKITVIAHRADPALGLSFPEPPSPRVLDIPKTSHTLGIKNKTRVPILLHAPSVRPVEEPAVWDDPAPSLTILNNRLEEERETEATLLAVPRPLAAFWKSFVSRENTSHATLRLDVPFEVVGTRKPETLPSVSALVHVRFVATETFLVCSLLAGAVLGVGTALLIPKERHKVVRSANTGRTILAAIAQRVGLAIVVSLVVFLIFWLVRGEIGLFDISLNAETSASAFLIGFLVGTSPPFFYGWIKRIFDKPASAAGGTALLLLLGAAPALAADSFIPVSLAHEPGSNEMYVLGSANDVYRFDLQNQRWTRLELPRVEGSMTSLCLVRRADRAWLASVATLRSGITWRTTVSLAGLTPGARSFRSTTLGFGRPYAVTYDDAGSRLVFADEERGGIYQMAVGPDGLGRERLLYKASKIREPISVLAAGSKLYIGDDSREAAFELDLANPTRAREIFEVEEPSGLALDENGAFLYVADSDDAVVLRYDVRRGGRATPFAPDAPFEAPAAVIVDRAGHVWVADRGADVVFELDANGRVLGRHAP